jgi:hypothetical protein
MGKPSFDDVAGCWSRKFDWGEVFFRFTHNVGLIITCVGLGVARPFAKISKLAGWGLTAGGETQVVTQLEAMHAKHVGLYLICLKAP